jgi:hypothetical protein
MTKPKRTGVSLLLSSTLILGASSVMASQGTDIEVGKSGFNAAKQLVQ